MSLSSTEMFAKMIDSMFEVDASLSEPPTVPQLIENYKHNISELKKQTLEGLMVMQKVKKYVEDSPNGS